MGDSIWGLSTGLELPSDIFRQDIGFEVNGIAGPKISQGSDLKGVGNQGNREVLVVGFDERKADSIDGDRTFGCHLTQEVDRRGKLVESPLPFGADLP